MQFKYTGNESRTQIIAKDPNFRPLSNLGLPNYLSDIYGNVICYPSGKPATYHILKQRYILITLVGETRVVSKELATKTAWWSEPEEYWRNSPYADAIRESRNFNRISIMDKKLLPQKDRWGRNYVITRYGEIWCATTSTRCTGTISPNTGYKHIGLGRDTNLAVHRLVAKYFVPIPQKFTNMHLTASDLVVNHIDGDKLNNCADNLEWTTQQGNIDHAQINGLYTTTISEERLETVWKYLAAGKTDTEISKLVNIPSPTISNIRNRTCPRYDTPNYTWRKSSISDETIEKRYARDKALIADYNAGNNTAYLVDKYHIDSKTIYGILNRHPELVTRVRKKCSSRVKLNDQIVTEIYNLFVTTELNNYDIAKKYGCSPAAVLDIRRGRTFRRLGEQYRIEHGNWDGWLDTTM